MNCSSTSREPSSSTPTHPARSERLLPEMDSDAVDSRVPSESLAPARRLRRADLQPLRLLTTHQGRAVPTVGGMLLFGRHREQHVPDA